MKKLTSLALTFFLIPLALADSLVQDAAQLQLISSEFKFTEGPIADKVGNVYFTDQPNNRIMLYKTSAELETFMQPAGRSNGLYFTAEGKLIACADEKNELWLIDPKTKEKTIILDSGNGKKLNGPNDAWIAPNGGIYFSNPHYKRPWWQDKDLRQEMQGIYYIAPGSKKAIIADSELVKANGLVGTPDGKKLYIADIGDKKTYSYDIRPDGSLSNKQLFCNMGSDGMTIDEKGNIYLTGKGVHIFSPEGKKLHHIDIKGWTANICFGGKEMKTLFITQQKNFYSLKMKVSGPGAHFK